MDWAWDSKASFYDRPVFLSMILTIGRFKQENCSFFLCWVVDQHDVCYDELLLYEAYFYELLNSSISFHVFILSKICNSNKSGVFPCIITHYFYWYQSIISSIKLKWDNWLFIWFTHFVRLNFTETIWRTIWFKIVFLSHWKHTVNKLAFYLTCLFKASLIDIFVYWVSNLE